MHIYLDLMSEMDLLIFSFNVVKSDVDVLTSHGSSISFPLAVSLFCGYFFCVLMSQTAFA